MPADSAFGVGVECRDQFPPVITESVHHLLEIGFIEFASDETLSVYFDRLVFPFHIISPINGQNKQPT